MEDILEPDLAICDPHHHLWVEPRMHMQKPYVMEDLNKDKASGHNIVSTVFVECQSQYRTDGPEAFRPIGETEFVVSQDPSGSIAGIVGSAELRSPEIADVLAAQIEAGKGRFRGIRQRAAWDASPQVSKNPADRHLLADPAFNVGFAELGRAGLSFDAWLYHHQLPELMALARTHPEVTIICNHLGAPVGVGPYASRYDEVLTDWRSSMLVLATCPNVFLKIGGIGMPLFGRNPAAKPGEMTSDEVATEWGDDIRWCIELFGTDRCMFESNFPPDKESFSYAVCWNSFKKMVVGASAPEKQALFHDTATRAYKI